MALIEGREGSGKPLLHTSGSSAIADNARDDYASNQIFEDDGLCPTSEEDDETLEDQINRLMESKKLLPNSS